MRMKFLVIIIVILLSSYSAYGLDAPSQSIDFLFMHYRSILRERPNSRYKDDAIFANGEYYFLMSDYKQAESFFHQYLNEAKDEVKKLFARAYLLKIAEAENNKQSTENLAKEIRTFKKLTFIFCDSKEYSMRSPLHRFHKAIYSINKVEIYTEGKILAQISY